ncbi:MAG: TauD/TfdA family dioxygenase [Rhodospirillaceae bacterium]|nr:TauD/TfdA family dioxygenase [Rhodospirillaceae bacterium]MBT7570318.1 TauD/TfdA family dioxygenase [Rhodospirillaceae bacterium]
MSIDVIPLNTYFGAEIRGLDLSQPLSDTDFEAWSDAFAKYRLLLFRDQHFSEDQHVEFSKHFGGLEDFVDSKDQVNSHTDILRVSNIWQDTDAIKPVDDPGHKSFTLGTSGWHIDSSFRKVPGKASLLFAIEIPPEGGGTGFADMVSAYEGLSDEKKAQCDELTVIHDFEEARRRYGLLPRMEEIRVANPSVMHPLVRTLPDGKKCLFLGSHTSYVLGMEQYEGRKFLDGLNDWTTQEKYTFFHDWNEGDLVMWDNLALMHRAMPYDLESHRRLLHRTTVLGDGPVV